MNQDKIIIIVFAILILFFILRNMRMNMMYKPVAVPVSTTVIYKKPPVTTASSGTVYYVNPPHYNAYKAQFYN